MPCSLATLGEKKTSALISVGSSSAGVVMVVDRGLGMGNVPIRYSRCGAIAQYQIQDK